MKDMMEYKSYYGSVHYNDEDRVFYGRVEFIRALISYEATNVERLRKSFREAVDDYLAMCKKEKIKPEQPFKGSFNVRIGPDLHRRIVLAASGKGLSLNRFITELLDKETNKAS
ncbi:MAG: type II toxin-antitoxin system HicB family antitoxin [Nitrospiria bacterium]